MGITLAANENVKVFNLNSMTPEQEAELKNIRAEEQHLTEVLKNDYDTALLFCWQHAQGGRAKSSGERTLAGVLLSLYDGHKYPIGLSDLLRLCEQWRVAATTIIMCWEGDRDVARLKERFGILEWRKFLDDNKYRENI